MGGHNKCSILFYLSRACVVSWQLKLNLMLLFLMLTTSDVFQNKVSDLSCLTLSFTADSVFEITNNILLHS